MRPSSLKNSKTLKSKCSNCERTRILCGRISAYSVDFGLCCFCTALEESYWSTTSIGKCFCKNKITINDYEYHQTMQPIGGTAKLDFETYRKKVEGKLYA